MKGRQRILGGCCSTRCILYSVSVVLSVSCNRCMLYSVYAVLSVNLWSWHGEIQRGDSTLCSAIMAELWTRTTDVGWWWERYGGYERKWEIGGMKCQIGCRRPCIDIIACWIRSHSCAIRNGKLTCIWNYLSPGFSWWFPISSHLSLSHPQLYHHLRTPRYVIPRYLSMPWSWVNIEYSIHWVLHIPSTAYTEYCIHRGLQYPKINCLLLLGSSHLSANLVVLNCLHSNNYNLTNKSSPISCHASLLLYPLQINHLQVLLQSQSIMASKLIPQLTQWWPQHESLSLLNHGLHVYLQTRLITAYNIIQLWHPNRITNLAQSQTPCSHDGSH